MWILAPKIPRRSVLMRMYSKKNVMKKTVLFVYHFLFNPSFGGIERVTDLIAKSLISKGYNVLYLGLIKRDEEMEYDFPCQVYFFPNKDILSEENILFYHQFLECHKIDIVVNQAGSFETSRLFLNIGVNQQVKRISVIHSSPLLYYRSFAHVHLMTKNASLREKIRLIKKSISYFSYKKRVLRRFGRHYKFLGEHSDAISLLSDRYKEDLKLVEFEYFSKVIAIPNPNSFDNKVITGNKENVVLFVGRLDRGEKCPMRLLQIWRKLYKKFPEWRMIIVGEGEERERLEMKVKQWSLQRIVFEGRQNPEPYYEKASIFCLTSNYEGFPVALTEAMQYGVVPVVFDSFLSVRDIISHGETGFIAKPFNITDFAKKLQILMLDTNRRSQMSTLACNYVKKFDIHSVSQMWVDLIENDSLLYKTNGK